MKKGKGKKKENKRGKIKRNKKNLRVVEWVTLLRFLFGVQHY